MKHYMEVLHIAFGLAASIKNIFYIIPFNNFPIFFFSFNFYSNILFFFSKLPFELLLIINENMFSLPCNMLFSL